jgi:hypothetical protein
MDVVFMDISFVCVLTHGVEKKRLAMDSSQEEQNSEFREACAVGSDAVLSRTNECAVRA